MGVTQKSRDNTTSKLQVPRNKPDPNPPKTIEIVIPIPQGLKNEQLKLSLPHQFLLQGLKQRNRKDLQRRHPPLQGQSILLQ